MKKTMIAVLVFAVLLVTAGIAGGIVTNNNLGNRFSYDNTNYSRWGMMQSRYDSVQINTGKKIDLEALEERVENYVNQYDDTLLIGDVFLFEDSDYYFSIIEADTGFGAMELLVNPYTGGVYPEFGPNMMWNLKYGMHYNLGYGMMGRNNTRNCSSANALASNEISLKDAKNLASKYLDKNFPNEYTVSENGHEFYGYYTFHIEDGNNTLGMLSVNGFTGKVWYHDWHGTVTEIIDGHSENDNH